MNSRFASRALFASSLVALAACSGSGTPHPVGPSTTSGSNTSGQAIGGGTGHGNTSGSTAAGSASTASTTGTSAGSTSTTGTSAGSTSTTGTSAGSSSTTGTSAGSTSTTATSAGSTSTTGTSASSTTGAGSTAASTTGTSASSTTSAGSTAASTTGTSAASTSTTGISSTASSTTGAGSTGGTSSSSTGSGGTTGAVEGVTDGDCGVQHLSCAPGHHCTAFGGPNFGVDAYHGCACTSNADCAGAGADGGATICDLDLQYCRAPRDYDAPRPNGTCDTGFKSVTFSDGSRGCLEDCTSAGSNGTCSASWTACVGGYCQQNDCAQLTDGGFNVAAAYKPCNAGGTNNGTCVPLAVGNGYAGICFHNGTATVGQRCTGLFGEASTAFNCAAGAICLDTGLGSGGDYPAAVCQTACNARQTGSCAAGESCAPLAGSVDAGTELSGFCVGSPQGDNAGFCGADYVTCRTGESCTQWGGDAAVSAYFACTCSPASASGADTCTTANDALGGGGNVACDRNTLRCRRPRDEESAFSGAVVAEGQCDEGYEAVNFGALPDGGVDLACLQDCTASNACNATWTHCVADAVVTTLPDGGTRSGSACLFNGCGGESDGGFNPSSAYQPCDVASTGDGVCQPLSTGAGNYIGYCLKGGTAGVNQPCSGFLGDLRAAQNCAGSALCEFSPYVPGGTFADGGAAPIATCQATCNASAPSVPNHTCTGGLSCTAFNGDPSGSSLQAGLCK